MWLGIDTRLGHEVVVTVQPFPKTNFVFQYDAAKSRIAWQKLRSASSRRIEVLLVGQFHADVIGISDHLEITTISK
jgi:hypothetical protein